MVTKISSTVPRYPDVYQLTWSILYLALKIGFRIDLLAARINIIFHLLRSSALTPPYYKHILLPNTSSFGSKNFKLAHLDNYTVMKMEYFSKDYYPDTFRMGVNIEIGSSS